MLVGAVVGGVLVVLAACGRTSTLDLDWVSHDRDQGGFESRFLADELDARELSPPQSVAVSGIGIDVLKVAFTDEMTDEVQRLAGLQRYSGDRGIGRSRPADGYEIVFVEYRGVVEPHVRRAVATVGSGTEKAELAVSRLRAADADKKYVIAATVRAGADVVLRVTNGAANETLDLRDTGRS